MIKFLSNRNTTDLIDKQYFIHRANEILRYGWIKLLFGSLIIFIYAWLDYYYKHNPISSIIRFLPIFAAFLFIIFHLLLFKQSKLFVLAFYNLFYVSLLIMINIIIFLEYNTSYLNQSTEAGILILTIVSLEIRGNAKTILSIFSIPILFLICAFFLNKNILISDYILISHQIAFAVIGTVYCLIKENINFEAFKTQLNLHNEKQKTEELLNSLTEYTEEIKSQKEEISVQRDQAEAQKIMLERQKIEQQSNMAYASKIQQSLLPTNDILKRNFDDYFVILKPRDIVSGDFYWSAKVGDLTYFAVADCTGHGVSADFMSILGVTFLNETIREFEGLTPGLILNRLRNLIIETLHQNNEIMNNQDGMDISLCSYNNVTGKLFFAGANSSMLLIRNNPFLPEIKQIKGDKMPVSVYLRMDSFTNQEFQIQPGDQV